MQAITVFSVLMWFLYFMVRCGSLGHTSPRSVHSALTSLRPTMLRPEIQVQYNVEGMAL